MPVVIKYMYISVFNKCIRYQYDIISSMKNLNVQYHNICYSQTLAFQYQYYIISCIKIKMYSTIIYYVFIIIKLYNPYTPDFLLPPMKRYCFGGVEQGILVQATL